MSADPKSYPSQLEKVKAITDQLEAGIQSLFESEKFKQYLKTLSKFHNYSPQLCKSVSKSSVISFISEKCPQMGLSAQTGIPVTIS